MRFRMGSQMINIHFRQLSSYPYSFLTCSIVAYVSARKQKLGSFDTKITLYSEIIIGHHRWNINMDTSLRLTSGASNGREPTTMSIGLLPSLITWFLPSLFLLTPPIRVLSFFHFRSQSFILYVHTFSISPSISPSRTWLTFQSYEKKKIKFYYWNRFQKFTATIFKLLKKRFYNNFTAMIDRERPKQSSKEN